jgi:hypothetical protein
MLLLTGSSTRTAPPPTRRRFARKGEGRRRRSASPPDCYARSAMVRSCQGGTAVSWSNESRMSSDPSSRRVLYLALAIALLWGTWGLVYETTGFPGLNYLAFGLVSPIVGASLFVACLFLYVGAKKEGRSTRDATTAMFISVGIAIVPFVALLQSADYS